MWLRVHQIVVCLDYTETEVVGATARRLACRKEDLHDIAVIRRSLDARQRDRPPRFVLTVDVEYRGAVAVVLAKGRVEKVPPTSVDHHLPVRSTRPGRRPVVIGAGPAGLMAALVLAEAGFHPRVFERGLAVEARRRDVETFWRRGVLDAESNVLFGEGGAGLFSDGKLTTRIKDRGRIRRFLQILVDCGAPSDILIDAEPHLGSDALAAIMPVIRDRIQDRGGSITFGSRMEALHIEQGAIRGVTVSGTAVDTEACFLATGHSARDVYEMLASAGVPLEPKPFAIGVRLEIPQHRIDIAQYGRYADHPRLRGASFRLTRRPEEGARSCYSFCMCPGGTVIACASSEEMLTTNGMSLSKRADPFGNAAFLVPVRPADFADMGGGPSLGGVRLQQRTERAAFRAGGGDFTVPAQPLTAFLAGERPREIPEVRSCTRAIAADLTDVLPPFVTDTLRMAIPRMLRDLRGVRMEDALLYGAETRSSSPVRVLRREDTGSSVGLAGLYPIGEGAGYAGGIVSSAVDGLRAAEQFLQL